MVYEDPARRAAATHETGRGRCAVRTRGGASQENLIEIVRWISQEAKETEIILAQNLIEIVRWISLGNAGPGRGVVASRVVMEKT